VGPCEQPGLRVGGEARRGKRRSTGDSNGRQLLHDPVKRSQPRESFKVGSTFKDGIFDSSYGIILSDGKRVLYSDGKEGNFDVMSARYATVDDFIRYMPNVEIIDKIQDRILAATKDAECKKANGVCKALEHVHERLNAMVDVGGILKVNSARGTSYGIILSKTDNGERTIMYNHGKEEKEKDLANAKPATLAEFIRSTSDLRHIKIVRERVEAVERTEAKEDCKEALKKAQALLASKIEADFENCNKIPFPEERGAASILADMQKQPNGCMCAYLEAMKGVNPRSVDFESIENHEVGKPCDDILLNKFRDELDHESGGMQEEDKTKILKAICTKVVTQKTITKCPS